MARNVDPIPEDMSIVEASEFWDDHSVADYPSRVVDLELEAGVRTTLVAVDDQLLRRLRRHAKEDGISVETLVNLWLRERLSAAS